MQEIEDSALSRLAEISLAATGSKVTAVFVRSENGIEAAAASSVIAGAESVIGSTLPRSLYAQMEDLQPDSIFEVQSPPIKLQALAERAGANIIVGVPIYRNGKLDGALMLATKNSALSNQAQAAAIALADLASDFLDQSDILAELARDLSEMQWLACIVDKMQPDEGLDKVTNIVIEAALRVLSADGVALYTINDETKHLTCEASYGLPKKIVEAKSEEQQAALLEASERRDVVVINDINSLKLNDPMRDLALDINIRSFICLQLKVRGTVMGLLIGFYRKPNGADGVRTEPCRLLAINAAAALNYSRLLEQSRSLVSKLEEANTQLAKQTALDGLTGLGNHRSFHQRLGEQVHRVGRYGEFFSLAMIDVDHFKAYNDAYGHQEGDTALKNIAAIISRQLRESDFAARYGGEEFAIILPHTTKNQALVAIERIRKAIDEYPFANGKVTVSAGISECPSDGVLQNEVLDKADRALYHAKLTGRNRVCLWGAAEEARGTSDTVDSKPIQVLIIESDREARLMLEDSLRSAGYELYRAANTAEAIALLRSRKFDIMLSDALLLDTDGMQVIGLASAIHPTMPIVVTTAEHTRGVAKEALRHGVTDLLVKPFNTNELPIVIERNLERKRLERQMLLEKSTGILLQAIDALVAAIDAKDRMTAGHSARVTHISLAIADVLGLPSEERYTLELAARLHDIGKISLPDAALNKEGKLSEEDWAAMRRHPAVGSQIIGSIKELSYIATIVRHHHERLDGLGYPDGLQGEAIPFLSRVIAVADAFEAMTSNRSYRPAMTCEQAMAELRRCVGTHYSEQIVIALAEALRLGTVDIQQFDLAA